MATLAALACAPGADAAGRCGDHAWCDTSLSPDARAELLLSALTQDERIALLAGDEPFGVSGGAHSHTGTSNGVPRLGLPTTYYSDGPVGPRQGKSSGLPIPMALAATFDPRLALQHGRVAANEARLKGNDVIFAPTVNIMRTPRNGRTFEGYGEDPFLVARTGVAWIRGAQSQGVIGNVKHFAANNQEGDSGAAADESRPGQPLGPPAGEGNRFLVNAVVDERTMREVYLPHFEAAVKEAHVGSVMCSYNRLNGAYACENPALLTELLKKDWGFKGYVLADYGAVRDTIAGLNAGLDFEPWPGIAYSPPLVSAAVASTRVKMDTVDQSVRRILRTLFAHGFFDRDAYKDDDAQIDKRANAGVTRRVEESAITLLENRGALPLRTSKIKSLAVIGSDAESFKTGGGSANIAPFSFVSPRKAIEERAGSGVKVSYDEGGDPERAAALAKESDVAIVFASDYQTEGTDRRCISLECPDVHGDQDGLIEAVAAANPRTVVVLETGGPVLTPWRDKVNGLLEAWYPGAQAGPAIARVLFGDADPGGRLPATFPKSEDQLPTAGDPEKYPGVDGNAYYKEGVFVGYRWFDSHGFEPAYPFGFGRSYTRFAYGRMRVKALPNGAAVSLAVTNTGRRKGLDVPQLYVRMPSPSAEVRQPPRQLRGYRKVMLRRGQTKRVRFRLRARDLAYWDAGSDGWKVAPGCYRFVVGRSSRRLVRRVTVAVGDARCRRPAARLSLTP